MTIPVILIAALLLDALLGEPEWAWSRVPHPVKLIGRVIEAAECRFNQGRTPKLMGAVVIAVLTIAALAVGYAIRAVPDFGLLELLGAAILLAGKSLNQHVRAVADGLRMSLGEGRREVARIVGRETRQLETDGVARAAVESAAEGFSDGVVAPAFWFLLLGLPGILAYKLVNTADSMIGHRTERYRDFGMATARLDDVLNWIPARIAALLIAVANGKWRQFWAIRHDASSHRSPNAGWPEAAIAATLDVALAGPRVYDGEIADDPYINPNGRKELTSADIDNALNAMRNAWLGIILVCIPLWLAS